MTTITLEVPDELAAQFKIDPAHLPALLREAMAAKLAKLMPPAHNVESAAPVYQEVVDFLTSSPTVEQVIAFKISDSAQDRLEELLYRNREEELTQDERTELETYLQLSRLVTRLKARARSGQPFLS